MTHKKRMLEQKLVKEDIAWTRNEIARLEAKLKALQIATTSENGLFAVLGMGAVRDNLRDERIRLQNLLEKRP
jgi:hypothetical protein